MILTARSSRLPIARSAIKASELTKSPTVTPDGSPNEISACFRKRPLPTPRKTTARFPERLTDTMSSRLSPFRSIVCPARTVYPPMTKLRDPTGTAGSLDDFEEEVIVIAAKPIALGSSWLTAWIVAVGLFESKLGSDR